MAGAPLQPGDSYRVTTYSPPARRRRSCGGAGPATRAAGLPGYLQADGPAHDSSRTAVGSSARQLFPAVRQLGATVYGPTATNAATVARPIRRTRARTRSPSRLRVAARDAVRVRRERAALPRATASHTTRRPQPRAYPLESFLFKTKRGYCQQFAGAMALLLRMGGVPARVAAGFTPGTLRRAPRTSRWSTTSTRTRGSRRGSRLRLGSVRSDPAVGAGRGEHRRARRAATASDGGDLGARDVDAPDRRRAHRRHGHHAAAPSLPVLPCDRRGRRAARARAARAARRFGRRAAGGTMSCWPSSSARCAAAGARSPTGVTLAALEHRFARPRRTRPPTCARSASSATAARRVRRAARQRRALRAQLALGLGLGGRLRALLGAAAASSKIGARWMTSMSSSGRGPSCSRPDTTIRRSSRCRARGTWLRTRPRSARRSGARCSTPSATSRPRAEFEAVTERAPTNDYAQFCLGRSLQLLGRHAEARRPLALAACLQPARRDYRVYRDRARAARGQRRSVAASGRVRACAHPAMRNLANLVLTWATAFAPGQSRRQYRKWALARFFY